MRVYVGLALNFAMSDKVFESRRLSVARQHRNLVMLRASIFRRRQKLRACFQPGPPGCSRATRQLNIPNNVCQVTIKSMLGRKQAAHTDANDKKKKCCVGLGWLSLFPPTHTVVLATVLMSTSASSFLCESCSNRLKQTLSPVSVFVAHPI